MRLSPASTRLALSLSMATIVTRESSLRAVPLAETAAKLELAEKEALVELGLAQQLFVPAKRRAAPIATHDVAWNEMGLASTVRLPTSPKPQGRRIALPPGSSRRRVKQLILPAMGDSVRRVLQPRPTTRPAAQPSPEGQALAKWLER